MVLFPLRPFFLTSFLAALCHPPTYLSYPFPFISYPCRLVLAGCLRLSFLSLRIGKQVKVKVKVGLQSSLLRGLLRLVTAEHKKDQKFGSASERIIKRGDCSTTLGPREVGRPLPHDSEILPFFRLTHRKIDSGAAEQEAADSAAAPIRSGDIRHPCSAS